MKKKIIDILIILTLVSAIISVYYLLRHKMELAEGNKVISQISEVIKSENDVDSYNYSDIINNIASLKTDNEDLEAWIEIEDSRISLPVMYKPEKLHYYLRKDFYQDYYIGGTPFIDERCSTEPQSDLLIIYGHHMSDGSMFTDILNYEDHDYYQDHSFINYYNEKSLQIYEIFALIKTDLFDEDQIDYYELVDFNNEEDFRNYIDIAKSNSLIKTEKKADYGDKILMLSTCSDHDDFGRFILLAKLIEYFN